MAAQEIDELRDFHRFVGEVLRGSGIDWSPEQALDEWRWLRADSHASDEDVAAIQEALVDMAKGDRGIPYEEFDRDFRRRHCLPEQS
jgi:hypothetical protein